MRSLSASFASLALALAGSIALVGCAVAPDSSSDSESTTTAAAELSSFGKALVGSFTRAPGATGRLSTLTLDAAGTYTASVQVTCIKAPCNDVAESGKWTTDGTHLRLTPKGSTVTTVLGVKLLDKNFLLELTTSTGAVEDLRRVPATCGGIGALTCASGLQCVYPDGPIHPDMAGVCLEQGARGTSCGGFSGLPCESGLACIRTSTIPDKPGVCRAPGDVGTACGGFSGLPCNGDLVCVRTSTIPDKPGVCEVRGDVGTSCGGIAALPCFAGLTCVITATYPDAMGVCTK